jgi:hypothetical protein
MPEANAVGEFSGVPDGVGSSVGPSDADGDGETTASAEALGVALAWAVAPGLATINRPAATIATTAIALIAITTDL